jgi:hypothetical protein
MARGDVTIFEEALAKMIEGNWASTDAFWCAICDDTTTPTAATATPVLGDFTQVGTAGTYISGGLTLGVLSDLVSEAAGTMTFDSTTNPSWAQDGSNDADAYWGIVYNYTDAGKDALAFVDLGGPVDMSAGDLTITWDATGIFTIS